MDYETLLQRAVYDLQARVGTFMQNGAKLYALKDRIGPYTRNANPRVVEIASALDAKATGLLASVKSLQERGLSAIERATALKATISGVMRPAGGQAVDVRYLGSAFAGLIGESGRAALLIKDMAALGLEMQAVNKSVETMQGEVADLDQFAQGRGLSARLEQAAKFGTQTYQKVLIVVAVGAAAYLFLPGILARVASRRR